MSTRSEGRLLFVYGSLKRAFSNHRLLATAVFVGECRTAPCYRLFVLGIYPALSEGDLAVTGELYAVDSRLLSRLDEFEGDAYQRRAVDLDDGRMAEAYFLATERRVNAVPYAGDRWLRAPSSDPGHN